MQYPDWLPADLRAEVEEARTRAEIALHEFRRRTPAPSEREQRDFLVQQVIRPTVIAFEHQSVQAARGDHRRIDEIPGDIDEFRDALATELCPNTHTWSGYADPFRREVRADIADSDEWLEHLKKRAGLVAASASEPGPGAVGGGVAESGSSPRSQAVGSLEAVGGDLSPAQSEAVVSNTVGERARVDAYIQEVLEATGTRITRKQIWMSAGYTNRREFERWQNGDKRTTRAARENFERVVRTKPHLKETR